MPEPTSTAAAVVTLAAAGASIPVLTVLGVPLGLRADLLIAGFAGGIAAIGLLNSVPGTDDTWREMLRLGRRRVFVTVCSALTAGYSTPVLMPFENISVSFLLGGAFIVGAGAQQVLAAAIKRFVKPDPAQPKPGSQGGAAP